MYKAWPKFIADGHLDPPKTARVGKRWIESGQVKGKVIDGVPWVDMDAWEAGDTGGNVVDFETRRLLA